MGAPRKVKAKSVTYYLDISTVTAMQRHAKKTHRSASQSVGYLIMQGIEREKEKGNI